MAKNKRIFFKGVFFSYLYIAIYLITGVLVTPMLLNYFKADYFALLMLVYTIITYLNNIKFGLPESLAVLLAKNKEQHTNVFLVKRTLLIVTIITILAFVLFYILGLFITDWRILLGDVYSLDKYNVVYIFYVLIIFALLRIPLDISLFVFIGFHEVYLEKIYKIINLLLNFLLIVFVINSSQSILFFVLWAGILDFLVSFISFIHMILKYKILQKNNLIQCVDSTELLKNGFLFVQLSMTQTIVWGAGILIVSHLLLLEDVTVYSLSMKIYVYIYYAYTIINTVIAPLYGKYFAYKSWDDIWRIFSIIVLLLPFFGGFIWISTIYFMSDIIFLWTGSKEFFIGLPFVFFMGIYFYFTGYVNSYITLLYSIGEVKSIILIRWKEVMVNLMFSSLLVYFIGLLGIAIGISSAVIVSVWYLPKYIKLKTDNNIFLDFTIQKKHFILILLPSLIIALMVSFMMNSLSYKFIIFIFMISLYVVFTWKIIQLKYKIEIKKILRLRG